MRSSGAFPYDISYFFQVQEVNLVCKSYQKRRCFFIHRPDKETHPFTKLMQHNIMLEHWYLLHLFTIWKVENPTGDNNKFLWFYFSLSWARPLSLTEVRMNNSAAVSHVEHFFSVVTLEGISHTLRHAHKIPETLLISAIHTIRTHCLHKLLAHRVMCAYGLYGP